MSFWKTITRKEDPRVYDSKDGHLVRSLKVRDFLALGVGTIVSTSIFTLPGEVAAMHTGPSVVISFLLAAIVAGLVAFAYAEMAAAMPFAGSAYSWINVVFGEFFGWVAGWALRWIRTFGKLPGIICSARLETTSLVIKCLWNRRRGC